MSIGKQVGVSLSLIIALGGIGLSLHNEWEHFGARVTVRNNVEAVQRQAANSTSLPLAKSHVETLITNVKELGLSGPLAALPWDENNGDYNVDLYVSRLEAALLTIEEGKSNPTETIRVIQDALTNGDGTVSLPYNMVPAYRWGGTYNLGKAVYDTVFNVVTAFILGALVFLVIIAFILK